MRFCLGMMEGLRATMAGFDCASTADRTMQGPLRTPAPATSPTSGAGRLASYFYLSHLIVDYATGILTQRVEKLCSMSIELWKAVEKHFDRDIRFERQVSTAASRPGVVQ
jgi:hypothetical protein